MTRTRLSVLLPNYNNAPYLKEALDSLFNQTFTDFVIYFVDDCSTDDGVAIAEAYQDDRLIIIKKDENSGIVDTLNMGLAEIETEYFIRMDGDDISSPNRFQEMVDFMDANPMFGVCSCRIQTFGIEEKLLEFEENPLMNRANLIFGHSIGHASSIFRTAVLKENGIQYRNLFWRLEDYDLFYQLKDVTLTTSTPYPYYHYRQEAYNNNTEITIRKNEAFKSFYEMVLTDLDIEANPEMLSIHLQLNNREKTSFSLKDYQKHIERLCHANKKSLLYPVTELNRVLDDHYHKLLYRLMDERKISISQVIHVGLRQRGVWRYYFGTRFKKKS